MKILLILVAVMMLVSPVLAQNAAINAELPGCIPHDNNALVSLRVTPESGWAWVRLYFRAEGNKDFYFIEMRAAGFGKYWAVLPKPEKSTEKGEVFLSIKDFTGRETRTKLEIISKNRNCKVTLTEEQSRFANNLVVGETVVDQRDKPVIGWLCEGIISRFDTLGALRPDEQCRRAMILNAADVARRCPCVLAAAVGGVVGGGIVIVTRPEASKARP